jgi:hypothetical protein
VATDALESHDYVSLARDRIGLFAVDSEIVVAPEDVRLRSRRGRWWRWWAKGITLRPSLRDNATHWTTRFRSERHLERAENGRWDRLIDVGAVVVLEC